MRETNTDVEAAGLQIQRVSLKDGQEPMQRVCVAGSTLWQGEHAGGLLIAMSYSLTFMVGSEMA
jgi:hypothetical protein